MAQAIYHIEDTSYCHKAIYHFQFVAERQIDISLTSADVSYIIQNATITVNFQRLPLADVNFLCICLTIHRLIAIIAQEKGSSRRGVTWDCINILGLSLVQSEMTRL